MNMQIVLDTLGGLVQDALKNGDIEMALGMVMGAQLTLNHAQLLDAGLVERFFEVKQWPWQAMGAHNDRQLDNAQRQEWHETQQSLEESVR